MPTRSKPAGRPKTAAQSDASPGGLRITQVRSGIATKPKHRATLRALGLRGIGQHNVLPDRPEIRGMLARVPHLVTIEPVAASEVVASPKRSAERVARSNAAKNEVSAR